MGSLGVYVQTLMNGKSDNNDLVDVYSVWREEGPKSDYWFQGLVNMTMVGDIKVRCII